MDINEARASIGEFCMNDCNAYCCKKDVLALEPKEAEFIREKLPDTKNLFKKKDWFFLVNGGCEFLDDAKCTIHSNPRRPVICGEYPIFEIRGKIRLSSGCPAVQQEKLYPYIKSLLTQGYKFETDYVLSK